MTIKEFYEKTEGDYNGVLQRLMSEKLVSKFVRKFPADQSFAELQKALEEKNVDLAFRSAHTLKGVCANLGLTKIFEPSSELTEKLRAGELEGTEELFAKVKESYEKTVEAIGELGD